MKTSRLNSRIHFALGVFDEQPNNSLEILTKSLLEKGCGLEECVKEGLKLNQTNQHPSTDEEVTSEVENYYNNNQKVSEQSQDDDSKAKKTSFIRLSDGRLAEMLFDKDTQQTSFALYDAKTGQVAVVNSLIDRGKVIYPLDSNEIFSSTTPSVWFPSKAESYATEKELFDEIKDFISRYLIVDTDFLNLATSYVMLTYLYDCFGVLPYLRVLGDFGTGKSRFLQTIGLICYKPMICTGAMGPAPVFRVIETYKGTLILDEANFQDGDVGSQIMQILCSGFEKKAPVLRCVGPNNEVKSFQVFGPKIISSRSKWKDTALESRCITWPSCVSNKAPLNLDDKFDSEALALRNKLLMYRFRNYAVKTLDASKFTCPVEPRIRQILLPLISMSQDAEIISQINEVANNLQKDIVAERENSQAGRVLEAIKEIEDGRQQNGQQKGDNIFFSEIEQMVNIGIRDKFKLSTQGISRVLRSPELGIPIEVKHNQKGRSIICRPQQMDVLYQKYGIA